jgi:hypothetical protein
MTNRHPNNPSPLPAGILHNFQRPPTILVCQWNSRQDTEALVGYVYISPHIDLGYIVPFAFVGAGSQTCTLFARGMLAFSDARSSNHDAHI